MGGNVVKCWDYCINRRNCKVCVWNLYVLGKVVSKSEGGFCGSKFIYLISIIGDFGWGSLVLFRDNLWDVWILMIVILLIEVGNCYVGCYRCYCIFDLVGIGWFYCSFVLWFSLL